MDSRFILVYIDDSRIFVSDIFKNTIYEGDAKEECSDAIQAAIDYVNPGGEVRIHPGYYFLKKTIVFDNSTTISGSGKSTVLVSPPSNFAISFMYTERTHFRTETYIPLSERLAPDFNLDKINRKCNRLYGAELRNLTIDGNHQGKGISMQCAIECTVENVSIYNTHAGAGIYLKYRVMESTFTNIHMLNNGNRENKEAAIVVSSQDPELHASDAINNLYFDKVFVIYPNYIAMDIGGGGYPLKPRLINIINSMFHGNLPIATVVPYDFLKVNMDENGERGLRIGRTRFTVKHEDCNYIDVKDGDVLITECIIGANNGNFAINGDKKARIRVLANSFHTCESSNILRMKSNNYIFRDNEIIAATPELKDEIVELYDNKDNIIIHKGEV